MLSYQHAYHAGNLADVHKHAALAHVCDYLTRKDKPLSYIETHAGRGLYDLRSPEASRTGEAEQGILRAAPWFPDDHPYSRARARIAQTHGPDAYPGSPLIARTLLRATDSLHLAELHPQEHAALRSALGAPNVHVHHQDGFALAQSLCPPTPRRGLMLVDPSWELKEDYVSGPKFLQQIHAKWNVGVLILWYPILSDATHRPMTRALAGAFPEGLMHEVAFPPARKGHRMTGSGLFAVNPPWGLAEALARLSDRFAAL